MVCLASAWWLLWQLCRFMRRYGWEEEEWHVAISGLDSMLEVSHGSNAQKTRFCTKDEELTLW